MQVFVLHFVSNNTSYTSYFDTNTNTGNCVIQGPNAGNPPQSGDIPIGEHKEFCSDNPSTTKVTTTGISSYPYFSFVLEQNSAFCTAPPPTSCDASINSITLTQETEAGANDGKATINASTSFGPLQYSINGGSTLQPSNLFEDLAPGNYTAYIKDANDCTDTQQFTIIAYNNPVQNFTDELPVVEVTEDNISRWNAVFNPIVIKYQRKDYVINTITEGSTGQIKVSPTTTLTQDEYLAAINVGLYFKSEKYEYYGKADSYTNVDGFTITAPYLGDDSAGFININSLKPNFLVQTEITTGNNPVQKDVLYAEHSPDHTGFTFADMSPYLQSLLSPDDTYNYLQTNYKDYNLAGSYTIRYREVWDTGHTVWYTAPYPMYYTYAAQQLGDKYGGNMAEYVPFYSYGAGQPKAKFLTGFKKPRIWKGLPFDLSFISSEYIQAEALAVEVIPDCGTFESALLLNADRGYILSADRSRFIIERVYNENIQGYPIIPYLGVNRLLIPNAFDCCATDLQTNIYFTNLQNEKTYIMQDIHLKHECTCDDPYVYLKWINKLGAWDYWRFGYNQQRTTTTSNSEQVQNYVRDWEFQQTIEDFISRSGVKKLALVQGNLTLDELDGLSWIGNSRRVQMLVSTNPIKWQTVIISDGDFPTGQTRTGMGNVKLSISLPSLNIQRG